MPRLRVTPLTDAVNEALANRPELSRGGNLRPDQSAQDTRLFRDQTKPQVDLIGSYTRNGLAGPQITQSGRESFYGQLRPSDRSPQYFIRGRGT